MHVRRMLKQDVPAVVAIEKEDKFPWSELDIRSTYRARHVGSWVVEDGEVMGYAISTTDWMITSILRFRVGKAYRGMGAGAALLTTLLNANGDTCSIEVPIDESESAAQVLFSRHGFTCVNKTDTGYIFRKGNRFLTAPDLRYRITANGQS